MFPAAAFFGEASLWIRVTPTSFSFRRPPSIRRGLLESSDVVRRVRA